MATGWNYVWGESWHEYIQRKEITNDLTAAHRESSSAMLGAISGQTASILTGMNSVRSQISSSMDDGFNMLGSQMDMIVGEISGLNASFQWGFGQMIAQMGGMNDSLKALIQIAKTPAQTAAYEQFEIARDAFRQGLYTECLEALAKAISGDHTSPGYKLEWRFHQLAAVVRLGFYGCDMAQVDPAQAEQAFLFAARYAKVDDPKEAAKAMLSAGWSAYVQGKLPEALKHTEQAIALDAKLSEAFFQVAKISMAAGKPGEALPVLRKAIDQSPGYIIKAAADGDFKPHEGDLNNFFEALRKEALAELYPKVVQALKEALTWAKDVREVADCMEILDHWRDLLNGDWGLLDLMNFRHELFKKDLEQVHSAYTQGTTRLRNDWRSETRPVKVEREVDEQYQVEEKYQEEVVIKPAKWFSKAQTKMVSKTRIVTVTRRVLREVEEQKQVLVNGLGEILVNGLGDINKRCPVEHFKFVHIPAGVFIMGTPSTEFEQREDEFQHEVTINKPFEMMIYPVTQAIWQAVMGSNPSFFKGPDLPVEQVSWNDAQEFIKKLNGFSGTNRYRLPTEAEWEYACRAGTQGARYGELDEIAWYSHNSGDQTHPVGEKKPNAWGLYDMLGNVCEWCNDWYEAYSSSYQVNPQGPPTGSTRVVRGGSWIYASSAARCADRGSSPPTGQALIGGFRCARTLDA